MKKALSFLLLERTRGILLDQEFALLVSVVILVIKHLANERGYVCAFQSFFLSLFSFSMESSSRVYAHISL